ncbi:hypothetical protein [Cyclobacterium jeungdonense]|uniref:Uncharacterized protein n=1 Tax=Cyclobacterium jeungdonense TaxID=708087 RepID=A0ABT8C9M8_9BACT|nr:hypothetical protein [Cyclobacterium jeungdonense]MDN3688470.1 hypothetical protein [Cyclobacterium jeungdonense]
MKIINYFLFALLLIGPLRLLAQSETEYFNQAARQYVNEDIPGTSQLLAEGLEKYPNDPRLNALWEKLQKDQEEQEKQDQENKEQQEQDQEESQEQEQQDQQSEDQESGEGEEETQEDGADESDEMEEQRGEQTEEESEDPGSLDSDLSDREKAMEELRQRLQEMNITPEQATQILDAMNSNELRYIQQNRKKPTEQPKRGLPDY